MRSINSTKKYYETYNSSKNMVNSKKKKDF